MRITLELTVLHPAASLRIAGTVTDTGGSPLSRRVLLYDESQTVIAETTSNAAGQATFVLSGKNANNRFVARAIGHAGECDDISCPIQGTAAGT